MSRSRTGEPLSRESLCPDRESRRVTTTSRYAMGRSPSLLSRKRDTSVTLTGRRAADPWKITSSIFPPRSSRADCSPSTHRTASDTLDLPQPLGPTMAVTPSSKVSVTPSAKDLKPESSSLVSFMRAFLLRILRGHHERRHADPAARLFRLLPGGVGTEHDTIRFVAPRRLEDRRGQAGGPQPLGQLLRPDGVLRAAH